MLWQPYAEPLGSATLGSPRFRGTGPSRQNPRSVPVLPVSGPLPPGASQVVQNGPMSDHGAPRRHRPRVVPSLLGAVAAAGCWVLLVAVAIDLGSRARDGEAVAWLLLGLAGLGAALCLVVALFFGRLLLLALGFLSDYEPKRARR
jgi:hypothetical protein